MIVPDLSRAEWRRSKHSGTNGNCLDVAPAGCLVGVRDGKDPEDATLVFTPSASRTFAAAVLAGKNRA